MHRCKMQVGVSLLCPFVYFVRPTLHNCELDLKGLCQEREGRAALFSSIVQGHLKHLAGFVWFTSSLVDLYQDDIIIDIGCGVVVSIFEDLLGMALSFIQVIALIMGAGQQMVVPTPRFPVVSFRGVPQHELGYIL